MGILRKVAFLGTAGMSELAIAGAKAVGAMDAVQRANLERETNNFTKAMVVRTYKAKDEKKMAAEGSILIENGYALQGQSGFAENKGISWTSVFTANRSKGITTVTFVKQG
jgi:hypothetical protein